MCKKTALIVSLFLLSLIISACTTRDALDTSYLTPKADIPSVPPTQTNPNDASALVQPPPATQTIGQTANQNVVQQAPAQPAVQQPQVSSSNLTSPTTTASTPTTTASLPAPSGQASISFTPVIGAPVEAVQPLSRQLGTEARARGIVILQTGDANSKHILKGYFSAFTDGDQTTVGFVWDVLDTSGTRLHRIRGQEQAPGTAEDPWDRVEEATMEAIAARTIADYLAWRNATGG
ncbi:MAG: hypothetical protein AAGC96_12000 [Pseudomonadota bacterium]